MKEVREGNAYPESKLTFEARLKVKNEGGRLVNNTNSIEVVKARSVTMTLVAATNFVDYKTISANPSELCEDVLAELESKSYKDLKSEHVRDYQKLFNRVKIDLGSAQISRRPTNERLVSFQTDEDPYPRGPVVSVRKVFAHFIITSGNATCKFARDLE